MIAAATACHCGRHVLAAAFALALAGPACARITFPAHDGGQGRMCTLAHPAPVRVVLQDFRRRSSEQLHEAQVTSSCAVDGSPVRRCEINGVPASVRYWDVTYDFRGRHYHVRMATAPGRTIRVNRRGDPRG
jgi:hypothetical protein